MTDVSAVTKMKNILAANIFEGGMLFKFKITLQAEAADKQVVIDLPGFYAVNDNIKEQILFIDGVSSI